MSEGTNELNIYIRLVTAAAEKASQAFHARERERINSTAAAQDKADRQRANSAESVAKRLKQANDQYAKAKRDAAKQEAQDAKSEEQEINSRYRARIKQFDQETKARDRLHKEQMSRAAQVRLQSAEEQAGLTRQFTLLERLTGNIQNNVTATGQAKVAADQHASAIAGIAKAYTQMRIASEIGQMANAAFQAMGQSAAAARDYVKGIVEEMERARTVTKELANLEGKKPTASYTAALAREAAEVGTTPEEYAAGKKAHQEFGAQYIGQQGATPEQRTQEIKEGKLSYEVSQEAEKKAMMSLTSLGLNKEEGMKLLGTVEGKMGPNATSDDIALEFRKLVESARTATGSTAVGIGQLQEIIQESVDEGGDLKSMQDAAVLASTMAELNPQEGATFSRGLLRGLRGIRKNDKGQMDELGITKDMGTFQQIEQADKRIKEIAAESGRSESDVASDFFPDVREFKGAEAAFNKGLKGGFDRTRNRMAANTTGTMATEDAAAQQTEEFRKTAGDSRIKATQREIASKYVNLERFRQDARLAVQEDLRKPESIYEHAQTAKGQELGYGDREAQMARAVMADEIVRSAGLSEAGRAKLTEMGVAAGTDDKSRALRIQSGLSGPHADESKLNALANTVEAERKRNAVNLPSSRVDEGIGSAHATFKDQRRSRDAAIDQDDQEGRIQQNLRESAEHQKQAAKQLRDATKNGVPPALPARPHVQRD